MDAHKQHMQHTQLSGLQLMQYLTAGRSVLVEVLKLKVGLQGPMKQTCDQNSDQQRSKVWQHAEPLWWAPQGELWCCFSQTNYHAQRDGHKVKRRPLHMQSLGQKQLLFQRQLHLLDLVHKHHTCKFDGFMQSCKALTTAKDRAAHKKAQHGATQYTTACRAQHAKRSTW